MRNSFWRASLVATSAFIVIGATGPVKASDSVNLAQAPAESPPAPPLQGGAGSTLLQGGAGSTLLQGGAGSTLLQGGAGSTTLQTGTQSTTLQVGTQSTLIQGGASGSLIQATVQREGGPVNILFILDCSYSMKEKLAKGEMKMNSAKEVLQMSMARIPGDINVGLRVFGQNFSGFPMADCRQTALLVPLGQHNRGSIISRVNRIEPFGMTPLEYAIQQAAEDDFRGVEGTKTLILITDGADTCNGNPCEYIRSLPYRGIKLKVDVVGLDLRKDAKAKDQLNCIASLSGGKFYDANTAADLINSVSKSVDTAISGMVIPHGGKDVKNPETPVELHAIPVQP